MRVGGRGREGERERRERERKRERERERERDIILLRLCPAYDLDFITTYRSTKTFGTLKCLGALPLHKSAK